MYGCVHAIHTHIHVYIRKRILYTDSLLHTDRTVCKHLHETVHHNLTSVLLLAPVIRNLQNWALEGKRERWEGGTGRWGEG